MQLTLKFNINLNSKGKKVKGIETLPNGILFIYNYLFIYYYFLPGDVYNGQYKNEKFEGLGTYETFNKNYTFDGKFLGG